MANLIDKKIILLSSVFALFIFTNSRPAYSQSAEDVLVNELNVQEKFNPMWRAKIGLTTFRTTLLKSGRYIIAPSNGAARNSLADSQDGVYLIDAQSGQIVQVMKSGKLGDRDVNGVAVYQETLFFGDDDNEFFAFRIGNNQPNWSLSTNGDIEGAPGLTDLNADGFPDVVFSTEAGEVYAADGRTGETFWRFQAPWNKWDINLQSRAIMASPTLVDINGDDRRDVLIGSRNGIFYALNGTDGNILWEFRGGSGFHSSAFINNYDQGGFQIIAAESYGTIHFLDKAGKEISNINLELPSGGIQGLFSSPVASLDSEIAIGTSWWGAEDGFYFIKNRTAPNDGYTTTGQISATPIYADVLRDAYPDVLIVTESGQLLIFDATWDGQLAGRFQLPAGVEATPLVTDLNGDGRHELLIANLDGYLYAYQTQGRGKVIWGQFRGNNFNTGVAVDPEGESGKIPKLTSSAKGPENISPVSPSQRLLGTFGQKKAIVVGISDYKYLKPKHLETRLGYLTDLEFAEKDAAAFAKFLNEEDASGGNWDVSLLIGPAANETDVRSAIDEALSDALPQDLVFLFFSGHGRHAPNDESEIYFLAQNSDYDDPYSGIPYDWLRRKITETRADHVVFFVDACRSGVVGFGKGDGAVDNRLLGRLRSTKPNKVIFTSGRGSQQAFEDRTLEHGVFTYYLLKGLQGDASERRRDGFVDLGELSEYVQEAVRQYTRGNSQMSIQVPFLWTRKGFVAEDFPLSIRK